ncbi:hypothetical protein T484DRAFT_1741469 [Baffinella frigidus]|nr:hypothetical protein T484DRAFT_1741469 [Cryptophyta sp. CCMP2293]
MAASNVPPAGAVVLGADNAVPEYVSEMHRAVCGWDRISFPSLGVSVQVWALPHPSCRDQPLIRTEALNLVQVVDGEARILSITKGGAASRVGSTLLVGDRILAIDGHTLPVLGEGPAGTSEIHKRVVEAQGATISITGLHAPPKGASPARQLSSAKEYAVALMREDAKSTVKRGEAKSGAQLAQEARHPSSSPPK